MERHQRRIPRIPRRFANKHEFGLAIGWGHLDDAARDRAAKVTLAELRAMDMTVDIARDWIELYRDEVHFNPANPSAKGRIELMRRIIELLEE